MSTVLVRIIIDSLEPMGRADAAARKRPAAFDRHSVVEQPEAAAWDVFAQ
jgi:hypothetical protein